MIDNSWWVSASLLPTLHNKYTWSNNAGWFDFNPNNGGVTVFPDHLEGYAWSDNIGWLKLSGENWGVIHDGQGNLSGYAWNPNFGWIMFKSDHSQVKINLETGDFNGYAWSDLIGWISFNGKSYKVQANLAPPSTSLGTAILIAGSGAHKQNTLFKYSQDLNLQMYNTLLQRGYTDDDIIYFNPFKGGQDIDGDGKEEDNIVDYQLFDPLSELEAAFDSIKYLQAGQQFIFYFHGHANPEQLQMNLENWLSAEELKRLLDKVPTAAQQLIILDSCYSGSFLNELSATNRIIVASADAKTRAWNAKYDNFSEPLISELRRGKSIKDAFITTKDYMQTKPTLFGKQIPQLDGRLAKKFILGKEGTHAAAAPYMIDIHSPLILTPQQKEGFLWVKTSPSGENIRKVRAVLIPPNIKSTEYQGEATNFQRQETIMTYQAERNRYETVYSGFNRTGTWQISYQAQGIDGTWSDKLTGEVQASGTSALTVRLNQSSYKIGNRFRFMLDINEVPNTPSPYDLYAAIIFPAGYFVTISYPLNINLPGTIQTYHKKVKINSTKSFPIIDINLPPGLATGKYNTCGIITTPETDPWNNANWLAQDCKIFELK
ncbi:C13 family peptidase [Candidatus Marithrix sp. Canyon 246]|uniref:C13 family peptidase n=1 Tax=Candidatus Marithrix sp. Canyon 246 TaxID=1827136 RepID=UPI00084A24C1|nr:C13 family peptidase [Candidatus Marithrix sp. Canyon 246]